MEYEIYKEGELTHWGIKGMRWGIRRYQNKDGSLTKAGQRRYNKEMARLKEEEQVIKNKERTQTKLGKLSKKEAELEARNRALKNGEKLDADKDTNTPRKKSVGEMTDDELREKTNRMMLENNYYTAQRNLAASTPQQVSKGKKFMDGLVNDVVVPAAKNAGRSWLENKLKDKLGLNEKDPLERLEKQAKKLELEKKIKDIKKGEPDLDDLVDQLNSMSDDKYDRLIKAANVKYYSEALKGKGVKPDKGKDKKNTDDDDD